MADRQLFDVSPVPTFYSDAYRGTYVIGLHEDFNIIFSVADPNPGSGAFLTPGSQTHIFESLLTIF
jgi:hypothetical protein